MMMRTTLLLCCVGISSTLRLDLAPSLDMEKGHPAPSNLYLRIQKTGSTSFGRTIKSLFGAHNMSISTNAHYDWQSVLNRNLTGSQVFTVLRDPVERYLSEMMYISWRPRAMICQNMWDFQGHIYADGERVEAFRAINAQPKSNDMILQRWMNLTLPTRNRQLLYLLGFKRIPCPTAKHNFCTSPEEAEGVPLPSHAYDYDHDEDHILEMAKERLSSIHFGLTECMTSSVRGIASEMGWDPDEAEQFVEVAKQSNVGKDYHEEEMAKALHRLGKTVVDATVLQADENEGFMDYLDYDPLVDSLTPSMEEHFLEGKGNLKLSRSEGHTTYESMFDPTLVAKLRKLLHAEILLYNYAVDTFNSRHPNEQCNAKKSIL